MTWQPWSMSGAELEAAYREIPPPELLPGETFHIRSCDVEDEMADLAENAYYAHTRMGGLDE